MEGAVRRLLNLNPERNNNEEIA
uniref:Uncharacterized protein n=1 Tax=Glossina pallidipes TaxID=7398 RepID=A0A1A9ZNW5_GLOPL